VAYPGIPDLFVEQVAAFLRDGWSTDQVEPVGEGKPRVS
jgi:hypothetical protein